MGYGVCDDGYGHDLVLERHEGHESVDRYTFTMGHDPCHGYAYRRGGDDRLVFADDVPRILAFLAVGIGRGGRVGERGVWGLLVTGGTPRDLIVAGARMSWRAHRRV